METPTSANALKVYRELRAYDSDGNRTVPTWHIAFDVVSNGAPCTFGVPVDQMEPLFLHISKLIAEAKANLPHSRECAGPYEIAAL